MMHIQLSRGYGENKQTLGLFQVIDECKVVYACVTLELPDRDNQHNISCIPKGIYKVIKYHSPSKGNVLLLEDVPNRDMIEIHIGNYNSDILGCIIVGVYHTDIDKDGYLDVARSGDAMKKILAILPEETIIEIV